MPESIKVSVIIPIYGVEQYIERCARSLFDQSMKDGLEFIFVDDCTKDKSFEILKTVLDDYPERKNQVTILHHDKNKGLPQARKTGLAVAKGEFIAHCDSDDWVDACMYEKMYIVAKEHNADIVCCDCYKSDGITKELRRFGTSPYLLTGPVWNKLCRRSLYIDHEIEYPVANKAEDGALMVQLSFFAKKIAYIAEPLYYYFQNPESICRVMTEEAMLKRLEEERQNTELRINFLIRQNALSGHEHDLISWKKSCRDNLLPYYHKRKYRSMWRKTYPEINMQLLRDPLYSTHAKINFVMDYMGMRNFWLKIKDRFYK